MPISSLFVALAACSPDGGATEEPLCSDATCGAGGLFAPSNGGASNGGSPSSVAGSPSNGSSTNAGASNSGDGRASNMGGASSSGGVPSGNGGIPSSEGGASPSGGSSSDGGASQSGGSPSDGGAPSNGGSSSDGGASSSGGTPPNTGGIPSNGGASNTGGSVSNPPTYTIVIDEPANNSTVKGNVTVRGHASGFLNVEVWDATHTNPPLAQATPTADGSFTMTVNTSSLPSGGATWTVYAWDSPPGQSFTHTANVALNLTIDGGTTANDGTPDPGTAWVPSGYHLVFSDEFSGGSVDTGKWNTLAPWGVQFYTDSHQKQAFIPEAVSVGGGAASFIADRSKGNTNGQPYQSGSLTTNRTFTYGYFEARTRVPAGKGFWPAYWVTSSTRWPPEWDIFEIIDGTIFGYTHPVSGGKCQFVDGVAGSDSTYSIPNLYGIYHVYGFTWTATDIYWFVDGVMTEHYSVNGAAGANDPFWLNISLQVGGDWPGDPNASTPFPSKMDVDYVRVYQL